MVGSGFCWHCRTPAPVRSRRCCHCLPTTLLIIPYIVVVLFWVLLIVENRILDVMTMPHYLMVNSTVFCHGLLPRLLPAFCWLQLPAALPVNATRITCPSAVSSFACADCPPAIAGSCDATPRTAFAWAIYATCLPFLTLLIGSARCAAFLPDCMDGGLTFPLCRYC